MKKNCVVCGAEFEAKGNAITCSKECRVVNSKRWYKENPQDHKKYYNPDRSKKYYLENKEIYLLRAKDRYSKNSNIIKEYSRNRAKDPTIRKKLREQQRERLKDPAYKERKRLYQNAWQREWLKDPANREHWRKLNRNIKNCRRKLSKIKAFQNLTKELKNVTSN